MHDIAPLDPSNVEDFFEADARAFSSRMPPGIRAVIERQMKPERVLVGRDGGEIVATAASERSELTLPGLLRSPAALVVAVSVIPTHRRQGLLRALMRAQLDDLHDRGEPVAVLTASEGGIYTRFGYGVATFGARYVLDRYRARMRPHDAPPGRVRFVDRESAADAFAAVYRDYAALRAGEVARSPIDFAEALGYDDDVKGRFHAVYEVDGRIDGYVSYDVASVGPSTERHPRAVMVAELCSTSRESYGALWGYLLGIDLVAEIRAGTRPLDEPVRWMLEDHRQLRTTQVHDHIWVRLVDVPTALRARRYPLPGELVLEVRDEFCPWNSGSFRLAVTEEWGPAEIEILPSAAPAVSRGVKRLELDTSMLASIYLGGLRAAELAEAGRVGGDPEAIPIADRLFANDRPPYSLTSF